MPDTYTFVVPVWCVLLLVASQVVATSVALWRTLWLRRQVKLIEAAEPSASVVFQGPWRPSPSDDPEVRP